MITEAFNWIRAIATARDFDREGRKFLVLQSPDGGESLKEIVTDAPARRHLFHDIADFAAHLNRHAQPATTDILFDGPAGKVVAWYVPRLPGSDIVTCELRLHPRWARWKAILGRSLDQRALYRHLVSSPREDSGQIVASDGTRLGLQTHDLANAVQSIKVAKGTTLEAQLDDRGNYRVRAAGATTETSVKVPHAIEILVPIYRLHGVETVYSIELQIDMDTDGDKGPIFALCAPGLDLVLDQAQQDAAAFLRGQLADGFLVGLGTHASASVPI